MLLIATLLRRSRLAAPLVLCLGLTLMPATAGASPARAATAPPVKASQLPTWAEVHALYDGFDGGHRETTPYRETFVLKSDCRTYDEGPQADKGRYAEYFAAFDDIPVHHGFEQPTVFVMSFASIKAAKAAFKAQQSWITRCDGKTVHPPMETTSYDKVALGGLGGQRVAYRRSSVIEQTGGDPWYLNELVFWIRKGPYLLDVQARKDVENSGPTKAPLVKLAKKTLRRLP